MKSLKMMPWAIVGMLLCSTSMADGDWYAGLSFGVGKASEIGFEDIDDGSALSGSINDDDGGWKILTGYSYNDYVAIEMAYVDLGVVSVDAVSDGGGIVFDPGPVNASIGTTGYALSVVARMPATERFDFIARVGYFAWEAEEKLQNTAFPTVSVKQDGSDPTFGIGGVFEINDRFALRLEYEKFTNIVESDGALVSLGAVVTF